jgi:hypothetical protein
MAKIESCSVCGDGFSAEQMVPGGMCRWCAPKVASNLMPPDFAALARAAVEAGRDEEPTALTYPARLELIARHVEVALRRVHAEALASPLPGLMTVEELAEAAARSEKVQRFADGRGWYAQDSRRLLDHAATLSGLLRDAVQDGLADQWRAGYTAGRASLLPHLRKLEWCFGDDITGTGICPSCLAKETDGHSSDCSLARALAEGEAK